MSYAYLKRSGTYVYEMTVTHEGGRPSRGYRARLGLVHSVKTGRLVSVEMNVPDTYGQTAYEAGQSLDAAVKLWGQAHPRQGG